MPADPDWDGVREAIAALREIAVLVERGRISAPAALRLTFLLDEGRPLDAPADPASFFGDPPGTRISVVELEPVLREAAPTGWRLLEAEFTRLAASLGSVPP